MPPDSRWKVKNSVEERQGWLELALCEPLGKTSCESEASSCQTSRHPVEGSSVVVTALKRYVHGLARNPCNPQTRATCQSPIARNALQHASCIALTLILAGTLSALRAAFCALGPFYGIIEHAQILLLLLLLLLHRAGASPGAEHAGFMETDRAARRRTHAMPCPRIAVLPRKNS